MMKRFAVAVVFFLIAGAVGISSAYVTFDHAHRQVAIGAHSTTVTPTFDGYATIDFGPVLPRIRLPVEQPLDIGVNIDVGDSQVGSIQQIIARDAVIASQPKGAIKKVTGTVVDMAVDALLRGAGAALLTALFLVFAWRAVGPERRRRLLTYQLHGRQLAYAGVGGVVTIGSVALIALPERAAPEPPEPLWVNLTSIYSNIPADPILDHVEIAKGGASKTTHSIVESAIATYQTSVEFYGDLAEEAETVEVRTPEEGQKTALVVTDRHDNIGMDPVARNIADAAEANILIDLGDDTSSGSAWEAFSINSLAGSFEGFDVVAVAGNHDHGSNVISWMKDSGFTVLDGEPEEVAGIRFLGDSDPRSSGFTAGYSGPQSEAVAAVNEQDKKITETACEDGNVSTIIMHSPASAERASASGCVDLVLTGHLHRQVGPDVLVNSEGDRTVTLTTGSTGGAVYAFALGSKLRRPAQVTIVTFEDGQPVGLQLVTFETSGAINVQPYVKMADLEPEPVVAG